jgi:transposase
MKARPSKKTLRKLYLERGFSLREIASKYDVHWSTVSRWLDDSKIKIHEVGKRSKLGKLKLSMLEKGVRKYGVRGFARKLRIHEDTLRRYLKKALEKTNNS